MGLPVKIQLIKRVKSEQWYICLPSSIAQAMEFKHGEIVEWEINNNYELTLNRSESILNSNVKSAFSKKKITSQFMKKRKNKSSPQ